MRNLILLPLIIFFLLQTSCRKKDTPRSSARAITSFIFNRTDNPSLPNDITGRISHDTIFLEVPASIDLTNLKPTITFTGTGISPASGTAQNFNVPVSYRVSAEDGGSTVYKTFLRILSGGNKITSFRFEMSKNPSLGTDLIGIIRNDTITVEVPAGVNLTYLVPTIVHTGVNLTPEAVGNNFNNPVTYMVKAEDGSIRNHFVFCGSNSILITAGYDGFLYCINPINGSVIWRFNNGGNHNYTYHNGVIFTVGAGNTLFALNRADGSVKWSSAPPGGLFNYTIPVVRNGKVILSGSGSLTYPNSNILYNCDFVYAVSESNGIPLWITPYAINANDGYYIQNVSAGENIVCSYDSMLGLYVFDMNTGAPLWNHAGELLGRSNPIIWNNQVIYSHEGGTSGVSVYNGSVLWSNDFLVSRGPAISGNTIVCSGSHGMIAYNIQNQSQLWAANNPNGICVPYITGSAAYYITGNGLLISYNVVTGAMFWFYEGYSGEYLVVAGNDLYLINTLKKLTCVNATTGSVKWTATSLTDFTKPIFVVDAQDNLYHVTNSGERD